MPFSYSRAIAIPIGLARLCINTNMFLHQPHTNKTHMKQFLLFYFIDHLYNGDRFKYSFMCILISFLGLVSVSVIE